MASNADIFVYLIVVLVLVLVLYFKNYFRAVHVALKLGGPPSVPLLGNVLLLNDTKHLMDIGTECSEWYGPLFRAWMTIYPLFVVTEPQHLQAVMGSYRYSDKSFVYRYLHNFLGEGLITSENKKNRKNRKVLQPFFHINILDSFIHVFGRYSLKLLEQFDTDEEINVTKPVNNCVMGLLQETILGIQPEKDGGSPFRDGQVTMTHRITKPWLVFDTLFRLTSLAKRELQHKSSMKQYTAKIIEKRKQMENETHKPDFTSFLDMLVKASDDNEEFDIEDVINECCTFMLAGQDSTGSALVFSLYFLAKHPHIQEKVRMELKTIFGDDTRLPTMSDLNDMKYLEQCIKEAMRLYPSVPMLSRTVTEDVTLGKHTIPAGSMLLISPFATHRLPHHYPDPLKYDPDRFSQQNLQKLHQYAYIPFSAGPRNCIGHKYAMLEMKTLLSTIYRTYRVELGQRSEELILYYRVTVRIKGGLWLKFNKLEDSCRIRDSIYASE